MNDFKLDNNGIWVTSSENYQVKYPKKGSETAETIENEGSFWFTHRNGIIYETIKRHPFTDNFADIGGGNGFQILTLKNLLTGPDYFLIEPGYQACLAARKRDLSQVYNCTFQEFDFNSNLVHGFGLFDVLEHIPDDVAFLKGLYTAMPDNSYLYITVPTYKFLWNDVDNYGKHQRRYDKTAINNLISQTSFKIDFFSYFFSYLVVPTYLVRTIPYRIFGGRSDDQIIKAEFGLHKPNSVITGFFEMLGNQELNKIRRDESIAYGTSCIVVLKK